MPAAARKLAPIGAIAVPAASLALVAIAAAPSAIGDGGPVLLHDAFVHLSAATTGNGFSPAAAGIAKMLI